MAEIKYAGMTTLTEYDKKIKAVIAGKSDSGHAHAWSAITSKPSYYDAKAIKSITRSGTTFTWTCMDGTTGTFSQQDNNTTYSQATSSTLGLVKIGYSTNDRNYAVQLNSSGQMYVNVPWVDRDTNYTLSSFGITATAAELNYCDGVTSNIQTQLNGKAASSHNHSYLTVKGTNTINSDSDTTANWGAQQSGVHWYTSAASLTDRPSSWGYILNIGQGSEVHQIWMTQSAGDMYHRGGNGSGWGSGWLKLLDSNNYTSYCYTKSEINTTISDAKAARDNLQNQITNLSNSLTSGLNSRLPLSGGTMTGQLNFTTSHICMTGSGKIYTNNLVGYTTQTVGLIFGTNAIKPMADNNSATGTSNNRWTNVYAVNGTIKTSDESEKDILESGITESYENWFMDLKPILYKWKKFDWETREHDRVHCGLGAQTTLKTAQKYGLDTTTVAAICRDDLEEELPDGRKERYGIRYDELHGMEIHMIQKTVKQLEEKDAQIAELQHKLDKLLTHLGISDI